MASAPEAPGSPTERSSSSIRVAVRCRPFSTREQAEGGADAPALRCAGTSVQVLTQDAVHKGKAFGYDHVFDSSETQATVFQHVGAEVVGNALDAYNGCIFAYGQTGSGKTHSMVGDLASEAGQGILPRACKRLFETLATHRTESSDFQATVLASYLEIYNEKIFDLLSSGRDGHDAPSRRDPGDELQVRLHPQLGAIVPNLTECPMGTFNEALELFDYGTKQRAIGATEMNAASSRSHAVFTLQLRMQWARLESLVECQAKMHFVDLAGSERQKKSGATGTRLKEGIGINQALSVLGRVIADLSKAGTKQLPPFRESKLTLLLKDALMGNSRTALLACVSPSASNLDESVGTLEFASRCKLIKTNATKNEQAKGDVIAKLTSERDQVAMQLQQEQAKSDELRKQLQMELEKLEESERRAERALVEKRAIELKLQQIEDQHVDLVRAHEPQQETGETGGAKDFLHFEPPERVRHLEEELHERLAELEREQQQEEAKQRDVRERLEGECEAQRERERELREEMEALRALQDSWALNQAEIDARREEQHRRREAELSKLGMNFLDVDAKDVADAPRLVNLHPDPALEGCLVYYMPVGRTSLGSDPERCRVKLTGLGISAEVCTVENKGNEALFVRRVGGGLTRVNGRMVGEDGQQLEDGDRLAVGRDKIFQVRIPKAAPDTGVTSNAESEFERAMEEILAGADVDPQWENGIQKAMNLVKSDFGTQAANQLLDQAKRASEKIGIANDVLEELPEGRRDGVARFELSVLFDAHGLPEVCVVARRAEDVAAGGNSPDRSGGLRGRGLSAGIWELERFELERLPLLQERRDVLAVAGHWGAIIESSDGTWYRIKVQDGAEVRYVQKRFQDFKELDRQLRKQAVLVCVLPDLPESGALGFRKRLSMLGFGDFNEKRLEGLRVYLARLLANEELQVQDPVRRFFAESAVDPGSPASLAAKS